MGLKIIHEPEQLAFGFGASLLAMMVSLLSSGVFALLLGLVGVAIGAGSLAYSFWLWRQYTRSCQVRQEFTGKLLDTQVDALIDRGMQLDGTPREIQMTLLAVELVGFSAVVDKLDPETAFAGMKNTMDEIVTIAQGHGAYVHRTAADSLLCYFGHDFGDTPVSVAQGLEDAVECGLAIQRFAFGRNLGAIATKEPILPVKIGINTAAVLWGRLDTCQSLGFGAIGSGVYFSQKLVAACESYRLLLSQPSWNQLHRFRGSPDRVIKKKIQSKATGEEFEAVEILCLDQSQMGQVTTLNRAYREQMGSPRGEERHDIPGHLIRAFTAYGGGEITNISEGGCCLKSREYLSKGFTLEIQLKTLGLGFETVQAFGEVRWTEAQEGGYFLHGIQFLSVNDELREMITGLLNRQRVS